MKNYEEWVNEQSNNYPDAGKDAQPEVKEALERFKKMSPEERSKKPLLYWLLGTGTQPYKMSQEDSEYTDKSPGEHKCDNCVYTFTNHTSGKHICSQIQEEVKLEGWCKLWESGDYKPKKDE